LLLGLRILFLTSLHTRGNAASIQIPNERGRLTEEDIEKAVLDGERYAEEDKVLLERASNALLGSVSSAESEQEVTSPEARLKGK
jgi:molecular chaperone DnaK (HSP70)